MGGLKFFSFVGGQQALLYWGNGRVFLPLSKNLLIPSPPGKFPPSRLPVSNLEKKCIRLLDCAHFHETLTKIYFFTKKSFNIEEGVCKNLCIVLCQKKPFFVNIACLHNILDQVLTPPLNFYSLHQIFVHFSFLHNNFHVITQKSFIFSCSSCACTIFILPFTHRSC